MAVNMITSGFLLLVLVAGVQSAIKDLGEVCTAGTDTCVTPGLDLVCDTPKANAAGHCRVKATKACTAAGGLCVLGATCDNNVCTCKGSYTADAATGKCTPVVTGYGASCTSGSESSNCGLAGTANLNTAACGADSQCQCTDATFGPAFDGKCAAIAAANKVGTDCASANSGKCTDGGATTHLICDATSSKCVCDAGYFTKSVGGDCGAGTGVIGKACSGAGVGDCTGTNVVCNTNCKCATNYIGYPGGICYPAKGSLKGGCTADGDCTGGAKCTSYNLAPKTCKTSVSFDGACTDTLATVCAMGLTCTAGKCAKTVVPAGGSCANAATTECATGLICDASFCKTEVDLGGDCSATTSTICKSRTTCDGTSHKCVVAANYVGGSCSVTGGPPAFTQGSCQGSYIVCGATANGICVCDSGYKADPAKDCAIIAHMYGAPCTATTANTKGDCGDDSLVCSGTTSGTCGCATATGYTGGSVGGVCSKYSANNLYGACTTGTCTDTNAECVSLVCQCKTGYTKSFFTGQCVVKADATTVCTGLTCVEGSTCDATTHFCTCDTGMAPSSGRCLPTAVGVLGGPCTITATASTAQGTCTVAISKCESGMCVCEDDYTATSLAGSCRPNDAMMITTSSLLITLAAVISQLFVR